MSSPANAPAIDPEVSRTLHLGGGARARRIVLRALIAVGVVTALVLVGRWWRQRGVRPPPAYVTAPATRGELTITVTATGTLEARNLVTIGSEVSGRIARVLVDVNDRVTKDQVLAEIDPELVAAQVAQATAQLQQARAQAVTARATRREARQTLARVTGLIEAGVAAAQEQDAAVAAADRSAAAVTLADAAVAQAAATLRLARTNLTRTVLRSPIDGVVLARDAEVGQTVVSAFQASVMFQIAEDLRAMRVSVDVDEADIGLVHEGEAATFTVAAYLGRTFEARVVAVHNAARLVDRVVTYETELDVDNTDLALRPGMTVTADIVARRLPDALLIPSQALRFTPAGEPPITAGARVWILRDGEPTSVAVTIAGENDTQTAVTAPELEAGAAVIVNVR